MYVNQEFLKWREEKYTRERREERRDRHYEYDEDKRYSEFLYNLNLKST